MKIYRNVLIIIILAMCSKTSAQWTMDGFYKADIKYYHSLSCKWDSIRTYVWVMNMRVTSIMFAEREFNDEEKPNKEYDYNGGYIQYEWEGCCCITKQYTQVKIKYSDEYWLLFNIEL